MIRANVYQCEGTWYAARFIDGDYDCCDALDAETEADALAAAAGPGVDVYRVPDVDRDGNEVAS